MTGPAARTPAESPQSPDALRRARRRSLGEQDSTCRASFRCADRYGLFGDGATHRPSPPYSSGTRPEEYGPPRTRSSTTECPWSRATRGGRSLSAPAHSGYNHRASGSPSRSATRVRNALLGVVFAASTHVARPCVPRNAHTRSTNAGAPEDVRPSNDRCRARAPTGVGGSSRHGRTGAPATTRKKPFHSLAPRHTMRLPRSAGLRYVRVDLRPVALRNRRRPVREREAILGADPTHVDGMSSLVLGRKLRLFVEVAVLGSSTPTLPLCSPRAMRVGTRIRYQLAANGPDKRCSLEALIRGAQCVRGSHVKFHVAPPGRPQA